MRLLWLRTPLALKLPAQKNRASSVLHGARKSTRDRGVMFASDRERGEREPKLQRRRDQIARARARPGESLLLLRWTDPAKERDCRSYWVGGRSQARRDRPFATVRGAASMYALRALYQFHRTLPE